MFSRMLGGVLLIMGTSIGGGMLALPVATAQLGYLPAMGLMLVVWFVMTVAAFWLLEVNLYLPNGSNLISMAKRTLGIPGQIVAWVSYLLLLYCLLSAYIAGGADVVQSLLGLVSLDLPQWFAAVFFIALLSYVVLRGISSVDWANRLLLFMKLVGLVLLIGLESSHITLVNLSQTGVAYLSVAVMPVVTSFGYAIIIPNLRTYLHGDVARLRKVLFIGSLMPLLCYVLWEFATLGAIPVEGEGGLAAMLTSSHSTSLLMHAIAVASHSSLANTISRVFTSLCVGTSFLGVSLAMMHFLSDGLKTKKNIMGQSIVYFATYSPPFLMAVFFPAAFIKGLSYAGICCIILLLLLPALMAWFARYRCGMTGYRVWGGKPLILVVCLVSIILILQNL